CVFLRGECELLVAVSLPRAAADDDPLVRALPAGHWRDVLSGEERSFGAVLPLSRLVDAESGLAVYERL
ncbi:MAG: hypothetical protein M0T77_11755, partial [Actinomycetota bacterium]|nr:hypothetical protein [Actinomycetota bacterium]